MELVRLAYLLSTHRGMHTAAKLRMGELLCSVFIVCPLHIPDDAGVGGLQPRHQGVHLVPVGRVIFRRLVLRRLMLEGPWRSTDGRPGWPAPVGGLLASSWPSDVYFWSCRHKCRGIRRIFELLWWTIIGVSRIVLR